MMANCLTRWLGSGLGAACFVFLSGCDSTFFQLLSEGSQRVEALQQDNACLPELVSLRLLVSALDGTPPTQALVDEALAALEARLGVLEVRDYELSQWGEDSIQVYVEGEIPGESLARIVSADAQLAFRAQRGGTVSQLMVLLERQRSLSRKQEILAQSAVVDSAPAEALQLKVEQNNAALSALFEPAALTGADVRDAFPQVSGAGGVEVQVAFDDEGEVAFSNLTKSLAGTGRGLGIFLDAELLSSPVVTQQFAETGIEGGSAVISGNFTMAEARTLAVQLKSNALPAEMELVTLERVNNPDCSK